jgi:hypothetical protein
MTLRVSRLYTVDERMINKNEAVDGMTVGRGNRSTPKKSERSETFSTTYKLIEPRPLL